VTPKSLKMLTVVDRASANVNFPYSTAPRNLPANTSTRRRKMLLALAMPE
jgi:hypothetical protein